MGFLSKILGRRGEVGPPVRKLRRDRVGEARIDADRRFRGEQDRLYEQRGGEAADYRRRLDDDRRRRGWQR